METLYYQWRDRLLKSGKAAFVNPQTKTPQDAQIAKLRRKVAALECTLGKKTYELEIAGELSRDWT